MAKFKARKTRARAPEPTQKVGAGLVPSFAAELDYKKAIYQAVLEAILPDRKMPSKKKGYTEDRITLNSLKLLKAKAYAIASKFVSRVNQHSRSTTWAELEELGKDLTLGVAEISPMVAKQIEINVNLITNMAVETQQKLTQLYIDKNVDQGSMHTELQEYVGSRSKLIARDQNSKIFTSLNTERMMSVGLKTFIWQHSSAGKVPRPCHVARDGHEFLLTDDPSKLYWPDGSPADYDLGGKKGDAGLPGFAINCRCRMKPVVSLDD